MSARRAAVATSDVKTRDLTMSLPVKLTDAEKLQIGAEMAHEQQNLGMAEQRKKEVTAQLGATIESHRAQVSKFSHLLNSGEEYRDVVCIETLNYSTRMATVHRKDTGEQVRQRVMREEDFQRELPLVGELAAAFGVPGSDTDGDDD